MNILLIYPEFPDTFWSFKHALKFVNKKASLPPLGLLTVASMLPESWERKLVDLNVSTLTAKDIAWADMAFISAMAVQQESARKIIELCNNSCLKVVAGGPLFTSEPEAFPTVDHFVLNEAELTLEPFDEDLKNLLLSHLIKQTNNASRSQEEQFHNSGLGTNDKIEPKNGQKKPIECMGDEIDQHLIKKRRIIPLVDCIIQE